MAKHPKFDLKLAKNGEFYFNLTAKNGEVILTSETYKAKSSALNGIESVKNNAVPEQFETREANDGQLYFIHKAKNHQEIGRSEMYKSKASCENGIQSVCNNAPVAEVEDNTAA